MIRFIAYALLFMFIPTATPGSLVLIESDIRTVSGEDWFGDLDVVFRDRSYFVALTENQDAVDAPVLTLMDGPVRLEDLLLVHLSSDLGLAWLGEIGEPVLVRDDIAIVIRTGEASPFLIRPGIRLVSPLRVYNPTKKPSLPVIGEYDGMIDDMVSAVSEDSIHAVIQHLEDYGTRLCINDEYDEAAAWVDTWFGLHWIASDQQWFYYYGDQMSNVIAEIPGQISPDTVFIICGHLDSITWPMEDTAPGADDNASGSAAVLEAARVMALYNYEYTIRFICFGAEEAGMIGSDFYAQSAFAAGDEILGVVNLDMILFSPAGFDTLWIPYDDQSQDLAEAVDLAMSTYVPELDAVIEYDPSATYSDHSSFWQYGYPAVLGIEFAVDDNPYYHTTTDLLANYEQYWPFGTNCVRAAVAAVASLAVPIGPSGIEGGGPTPSHPALMITPNPATGIAALVLSGAPPESVSYEVFDISGRTAGRYLHEGPEAFDLDLSGLPPGVYLVRWAQAAATGASRLVVMN